jgi:hypothetical protein
MMVYGRVYSLNLNLDTGWKWVIIFKHWLLYP